MTPLKRSALLMIRELSNVTLARFAAGILGGLVMPALLLVSLSSTAGRDNLPQFVVVTEHALHRVPRRRNAGASSVLLRLRGAANAGRYSLMDRECAGPEIKAESRRFLPQFFQRTGPLTEELLLEPARFGLGLLPAKAPPDAIAKSVCGFCSTGCSLDIHLHQGQATSLTPSVEYPVNLGMACPKGWEALAVLQSSDRATVPLLAWNAQDG